MPFDTPSTAPLRIGAWTLDPTSGEMQRGEQQLRLEERTLRLLLCLVKHRDQVLGVDDLLKHVWQGVVVSPDSIYQAITALRRILGDEAKNPTYIVTVPRRGYRLIAPVTRVLDERAAADGAPEAAPEAASKGVPAAVPETLPQAAMDALPAPHVLAPRAPGLWRGPTALRATAAIAVLALSALATLAWRASGSVAAAPQASLENTRSVAVMPFQDLTDQMSEEPFADGMAEELIAKLSKVKGLAVSPPSASINLKEKRLGIADLAKALHVRFILDGSVRKSGNTLRVTARLTRAADGVVSWSETYDRSWSDKLMIQENIAGEVSKALAASIH
ncbi:MAG: winged helix-turn-helix domain-containing protein [Pseudomonadota bacterium]